MKKLFSTLLFLGGIMLGANFKSITISGVEVPLIYEQSSIIDRKSVV